MSLCQHCESIDFKTIHAGDEWQHLSDATKLLSSRCALCALIRATILQHNDSVTIEEHAQYWLAEPIVFRRPTVYLDESGDSFKDQSDDALGSIEISLPVHGGEDIIRLGVRNGGSALHECIVSSRNEIIDSSSNEAFALLAVWLNRCSTSHRGCQIKQTRRALPTRLLHIGSADIDTCHLYATANTTADIKYAALSHCWGKPKILTTINSNYDSHLCKVPYQNLSKTFQEAIIVTRRLGLQYIWIDSLCIIQDDHDDWKREAETMGDVYSGAEITIAATGASDGSKGIFMHRPKLAPSVTVPFQDYTIILSQRPDEQQGGIDNSPLDERAWITQEWLLSPRVVHYTQSRMIWSCGTITEAEDGERVYSGEKESFRSTLATSTVLPIDQSFYDDWTDIVRNYCSRSLTYARDKPAAIQGLANRLTTSRDLMYKHGVFVDLQQQQQHFLQTAQLFWFSKPPSTGFTSLTENTLPEEGLQRPQELSHIPTWSWVSTMGSITFHYPAREANLLAKNISLDGGTLTMTTQVIPIEPTHGPVLRLVPNDNEWQFHRFFSQAAQSEDGLALPHGLYYLGSPKLPAGWVSFDRGTRPEGCEVLACAVSENPRLADGTHDGINVLVLQRTSERHGGSYVRVGVGEVLQDVGAILSRSMSRICVV